MFISRSKFNCVLPNKWEVSSIKQEKFILEKYGMYGAFPRPSVQHACRSEFIYWYCDMWLIYITATLHACSQTIMYPITTI